MVASQWKKYVPLNNNSRICSIKAFLNSHKRKLQSDEYPTENLPKLATRVLIPTLRRPLVRTPLEIDTRKEDCDVERKSQDNGINTTGPVEKKKKIES